MNALTLTSIGVLSISLHGTSEALEADLPQAEHQAMLDRLCPILMVNQDSRIDDRLEYPSSIPWRIDKCRLVTRNGDEVSVVADGPLSCEQVLGHGERVGNAAQDLRFELRRQFNRDQGRYVRSGWKQDGSEPGEPRIYGMIESGEGTLIRVCYFWFYGFNAAEGGAWNHEGDWLCVDFDVDSADPENPRIVVSFFHNHGRQIMVDDPAQNLRFTDGHPHVYAEDRTHELWPCPEGGDDGFSNGDVPHFVYANERLGSEQYGVRGHNGNQPIRLWESGGVYDIGTHDDNSNRSAAEYRVFHEFPGMWGTEHGMEADNPRSPRWQDEMWKRSFSRDAAVRDTGD